MPPHRSTSRHRHPRHPARGEIHRVISATTEDGFCSTSAGCSSFRRTARVIGVVYSTDPEYAVCRCDVPHRAPRGLPESMLRFERSTAAKDGTGLPAGEWSVDEAARRKVWISIAMHTDARSCRSSWTQMHIGPKQVSRLTFGKRS